MSSLSHIFYEYKSLASIKLIHFKTGLIDNIEYMFYKNYKLTLQDLSNFNKQEEIIVITNWNISI